MRLTRLVVNNFGPLRGVELDLDTLGPGLVALCGKTGGGKSHLLNAVAEGPWYCAIAAHGGEDVFSHAVGELTLRATWEHAGSEYTFDLSGTKDKPRYVLHLPTGEKIGPNIRRYQAEVAKLVPPEESALASFVAVQKGVGSFFRLVRAKRYTVFASMLKLEKWDEWAKAASKLAAAEETALAPREQRVGYMRDRAAELAEAETLLTAGQVELADADGRLAIAKARLDALAAKRQDREKLAGELRVRLELVGKQHAADTERAKTLGERIGLLDQQPDRQAEAAKAARLREQLATLRAAEAEQKPEYDAAQVAAFDADDLVRTLADELEAVEKDRKAAVASHQATVRNLTGMATGLDQIDLSLDLCRKCPLTAEGREAKQRLETAIAEHTAALAALAERAETGRVAHEAAVRQAEAAGGKASTLAEPYGRLLADLAACEAELGKTLGVLADLPNENREALVEERDRLLADASARAVEIERLTVALEDVSTPIEGYVEAATEHMELAEHVATLRTRIATAEGQVGELRKAAANLAAAEAVLVAARTAANDLRVLSAGCQDVRKAEIRQAGPIVSDIATELLAGFQDGRFKIVLETILPKADGKGEKEDFVPSIFDTAADEKRSSVSGGETDVCDEALRGALLCSQKEADLWHVETALRDEVVGGLDEETAISYIAMLRQIRERAGLHQIVMAVHSKIVQRQCDRRLVLEDGRLRVE